jgi:hypothetical protein
VVNIPKGTIANAISLAAYPAWVASYLTYGFYTGTLPSFYDGKSVAYRCN